MYYSLMKYRITRQIQSLSWMEGVNGLIAGSSLSLNDFYTYLQQGPDYLRHIQVDTVLVVDHLGRNIPVPTIFCSKWEVDLISVRYWLAHTCQQPRLLTISSTAIAKIPLDVILSSAVITRWYMPTIIESSTVPDLPAWRAQERNSRSVL